MTEAVSITRQTQRPVSIAHIFYRFAVGGLENGVVNLINHLPAEKYQHHIICLTDYDAEFAKRLKVKVPIVPLYKKPGKDLPSLWRLYKLLRVLNPDVVHTRNLSALEPLAISALAGVPVRIHSEHGRDMDDLHGQNRKHQLLRRSLTPFAHRVIALSRDLHDYLQQDVGVKGSKLTQIYNGVDLSRFRNHDALPAGAPPGFFEDDVPVFVSVGRMSAVKDHINLCQAFVALQQRHPRQRAKLMVVGEGPERSACEAVIEQAGMSANVWFTGERSDVPACLAAGDVFVLPSLAEGISNTILEAMACGLPVIATDVGGNSELVVSGETGQLVAAADPLALAAAMHDYLQHPNKRQSHGEASFRRAQQEFSLDAMVASYHGVYQQLIEQQLPNICAA